MPFIWLHYVKLQSVLQGYHLSVLITSRQGGRRVDGDISHLSPRHPPLIGMHKLALGLFIAQTLEQTA